MSRTENASVMLSIGFDLIAMLFLSVLFPHSHKGKLVYYNLRRNKKHSVLPKASKIMRNEALL